MIEYKEFLDSTSFEIERKSLFTEDGEDSKKDLILRKDNEEHLGVVNRNKEVIEYVTLLDWVGEVTDKIGIRPEWYHGYVGHSGRSLVSRWKLSALDLDDPDGHPIKGMMHLSADYLGGSPKISLGTYREVCSNGAITFKIAGRIVVPNVISLNSPDLVDKVKYSIDQISFVSKEYRSMNQINGVEFLMFVLKLEELTYAFKNFIIEYFVTAGILSVLEKYSKTDLMSHPGSVVSVQKDFTKWDLYNAMTAIATHQMNSPSAQAMADVKIAKIFDL